jgi:hypothetical protein
LSALSLPNAGAAEPPDTVKAGVSLAAAIDLHVANSRPTRQGDL